jgi:RNA polymerase sigma-70 factor, ECF subfamily
VKDRPGPDMKGNDVPSAPDAPAVDMDAEALFRRHAAWVARYVTKLGLRGEDVDDVVQETFLVAHRRGGFREGAARPTTWLAEIALRVVMASRRARRRMPLADEAKVEAAPSGRTDPLTDAIQAQALANVQRALDSLDLERRALFVLFELEGESCDALATAFSVPVGTIYSRLHAARSDFLGAYRRVTGEAPSAARRARA